MFATAKFDDIKFVSNDETDMYCVPATFCMMLSKLKPDLNLRLEDLVTMCDAKPGRSVWPSRILLELQKLGIESVLVESFDADAFIKEGGEYLKREFGDETAAWQIKTSDITKEQKDYNEYLQSGAKIEHRIPTLQDLRNYLKEGWMVRCIVNAKKLAGKEGYVGHSVLVLEISDDKVLLHNPGLPPHPYQVASVDIFEKAWASPNEKAKEIVALRNST